MREIKFRAWDENNKIWVYSNPMPDLGFWKFVSYDSTTQFFQYTGLKDKNGKEIYQGDICKYAVRSECNNEDCINYSEVEYEQGVCEIIHGQCVVGEVALPWAYNIDIIGNKHENPELLEEK